MSRRFPSKVPTLVGKQCPATGARIGRATPIWMGRLSPSRSEPAMEGPSLPITSLLQIGNSARHLKDCSFKAFSSASALTCPRVTQKQRSGTDMRVSPAFKWLLLREYIRQYSQCWTRDTQIAARFWLLLLYRIDTHTRTSRILLRWLGTVIYCISVILLLNYVNGSLASLIVIVDGSYSRVVYIHGSDSANWFWYPSSFGLINWSIDFTWLNILGTI